MLVCLLMAACAAGEEQSPAAPTTPATVPAVGVDGDPVFVTPIDDAVTVNVASDGADIALAWISHDGVSTAMLDPVTGALGDHRTVNGSITPIAHPIERPALVFRDDGSLDVAFTSFVGDGASVFLSRDGAEAEPISGLPRPETNLVHMTPDGVGGLWLTWLEDSTLSVARERANGIVEQEGVDDLTCDCCHPVPTVVGDTLVVSYRDLETVDGAVVRNAAVVRSVDGGESFEPAIEVADEDWHIDGCPFTGPSAVEVDGSIVLAWMDARQSLHPDQTDSSIWVDKSTDGVASFGVDLRVTDGGSHRWPILVVDHRSLIHMVWETVGPDGGLSYAWSEDTARSFSDPVLLVDRAVSGGDAPASPSAVVHDRLLVVTWAARGTGYVAAWPIDG